MRKKKRVITVTKAELKYCWIKNEDHQDLQLYVNHKGQRLVIIQASLSRVLSEIAGLYNFIAYEIPKEIPGFDMDGVFNEIDRILEGQ